MSRTLNFCEYLLYQGRRFSSLGVDQRALRTFGHLARLRELPADIAEETQFKLGELYLKQRRFAKARRCFAAALAHDPDNPEYHYYMAHCLGQDRRGDRRLALVHFRRCVLLDPENPYYCCEAGLFTLEHGDKEEGLDFLRRAAELAPDDAEVIGDVVRGLQENDCEADAQSIARAAFFRNNRNPRFQQLWNDFQFNRLQHRQQIIQKRQVVRRAVAEGRVCLPFLKLTVQTPSGRKLVRQDGPSGTPAPHFVRMARLSGKKHA